MKSIVAPTNCPACGSVLEKVNDQLFCRNTNCEAKSKKQVLHFAKTLKIKGLGHATAEKLELFEIKDIYNINFENSVAAIGEKLTVKLFDEIEKSRSATLNEVLPALGISLVGQTATDKICGVVSSIEEINKETCSLAGLGPKVTDSLLTWIATEKYKELEFTYKAEKKEKPKASKGIVCISGKLLTYKTKAEATKALENKGYTVKSSLTKDVNILINESGVQSSKTTKAEELNIPVITDITTLI